MAELPTGTVTFLFTDIEGSTRLLDDLGDRYAELLAKHHRLMRAAFEPRGGVEVDTQGDAFFVAFERATDALAAAGAAQEALAPTGLRVRMGIHTGQPLLTETGYVGMDVHRAARIMSAGHGGQVVISDETHALLDGSSALTDLGLHRLKDLTEPQRLWQLGSGAFAPLKTLYQTNLPVQPTPLIGREMELAEVLRLMDESRLVTLTGAGGSGKTRLALQAAAEVTGDYKDGAWWVSLAALRDPELVESTIAQVVGAKGGLAEHLRGKHTLLLLDNFEQLLDATLTIADLLAESPDLRVLATSRERLGLAAEQEYSVPTMVPSEALALFTARARQLQPDFEPGVAVQEICRRLDGLPLAIELAAARIKVLSSEEILQRLGHSLDLLTSGARDAPERHQTLRGTIEWSHDLLDEAEQRLFSGVAVFAGSFSLEAAEAVCGADLDTLAALIDKSLVRRSEQSRFFMLETIREYAAERADESGAADILGRRHAEYYVGRVEPLRYELRAMESAAMAYLDAESDNLRAAMSWAINHEEKELAERLLCSLWFHWFVRGRTKEGDDLAQRTVGLSGPSPPAISAEALANAAEFARFLGDLDRAATLKEASIEALRTLPPDAELWTPSLTDLAHIEARRGNVERARSLAEEALALRVDEERRGEGWKGGIAHARFALANIEFREQNFEVAERTLEEIVEADRREGLVADSSEELAALAQVKRCLGKHAEAVAALRESVTLAKDLGHEPSLCECLEVYAYLAVDAGRQSQAAKLWGAADMLRSRAGFGDFFDAEEHERMVDLAKADLGEEAFTSARREGRALEPQDAVEYALASIDDG